MNCAWCGSQRHWRVSFASCLKDHTPTCNYVLMGMGTHCNCSGPPSKFYPIKKEKHPMTFAEFDEGFDTMTLKTSIDLCNVCGEVMKHGPPITPGSNGSKWCPYISEPWHKEAAADVRKQDRTLHLQRRGKGKQFGKGEKQMTFKEFDSFSQKLLDEVIAIRDTKGREYAGTKDRFDNFNRLAARLKLPRQKVWQVYFTKHIDAIDSYIEHGREFSSESIRGRIVDAITYLTLLAGMIEEDLNNASLPKEV